VPLLTGRAMLIRAKKPNKTLAFRISATHKRQRNYRILSRDYWGLCFSQWLDTYSLYKTLAINIKNCFATGRVTNFSIVRSVNIPSELHRLLAIGFLGSLHCRCWCQPSRTKVLIVQNYQDRNDRAIEAVERSRSSDRSSNKQRNNNWNDNWHCH
jgi:hypothetical protein